MFRTERYLPLSLVVVAATLLLLCVGCGGSSSSSSNSVSPTQAQAISQQVEQTVLQGLDNAFASGAAAAGGRRPSLATVVSDIHPDQTSGCTSTLTGENCDWPVSYTGSCPGGGTISVSGAVDGTLDNSGDGSIDSTLTITPASCSVSNLTINGDPNITVTMQIAFAGDALAYPLDLTETGGISYGPNPSGSCQLNVTYTVTSATACTITGTVCGQSVPGSC